MKSMISRRTLIAGALSAPAILTLTRGASAATNLTLGHNAAPGNPRSIATERFAELVKERSGGNISVRVAGSEQLGNEQSLLTSLRTGAVSMTVNSQGSTSALIPELAALGLPFLFEDSAAAFKVLEGPIGEELAQRFAKVQMVPLGWWDNGVRHITNSKRPVVKPADLKGLKIRTPPDPMTIDIFQALGAGTEQISFGELYIALQQGVVDGQENPLTNIASSKLFEVNKFISLSGHKWESSPFLMSQITWTRLSAPTRRSSRPPPRKPATCNASCLPRTRPSSTPSSGPIRSSRSTRSISPHSVRPQPKSSKPGVGSPSATSSTSWSRLPRSDAMTRVSPLPHHDEQQLATGGGALSVANIIDRTVGFVCRAVILLTGLALLVLLTANVVARYVMESGGFRFSQELPERLFPWFIMAGVALAVQKGGHMAVESVLARLSRSGARVLLLVGFAIIIASYAILGWEALGVADIVSIETSPVLGLSSSYSYYALALGCLAVILTTFALGLRVWKLGPEAMPTPDPEETGI